MTERDFYLGKLGEAAADLAATCIGAVIHEEDDALTLASQIAVVYAAAGLCISRLKLDVDDIERMSRVARAIELDTIERIREKSK
jgi:hypothetical protein